MNKKLTCIACPRGCRLTVFTEKDELRVEGHQCRRGVDYGIQELKESLRMLTTTVRTDSPEFPRLPVRLSREVPLRLFREFMKEINSIVIELSCKPGDIIASNLIDRGVDLIATAAYDSKASKQSKFVRKNKDTGVPDNER